MGRYLLYLSYIGTSFRITSVMNRPIVRGSQLVARRMCSSGQTSGGGSSSGNQKINRQRKEMIDRMLRVDHAGEYGAVRIYKGQIAVLGQTNVGPTIQEMMEQEKVHLSTFDKMLPDKRARPTVLLPLWHLAGYALGAGTAMLGKEGAMACTVAVETVIGEHYDSQLRELMADGEDGAKKHSELIATISKFRDEELEHLETGIEHDAEQAPFYTALSGVIKVGCKGAIWLSERI